LHLSAETVGKLFTREWNWFAKFKEHNVQIPFPQRDIHLKSGFEKVADKMEK
jgi:small-conductance mechanosensitive channel